MQARQDWKSRFTAHPASVGESYGEHFVTAMGFSTALLRAALVCAVHAVLPFLFEKTGSECIHDLHRRMVTHRAGTPADDGQDPLQHSA